MEYFLKHLLGTHNNVMPNGYGTDDRPRDVVWRRRRPARPADHGRLPHDVDDPALRHRAPGRHLVREARPQARPTCTPTCTFTPAIDPPWETRTDFDVFTDLAHKLSQLAKGRLDKRLDLVAVPLQHDGHGQIAQPGGHVPAGRTPTSTWCPGATPQCSRSSSATTRRSPTSSPPSARWRTSSASRSRTSTTTSATKVHDGSISVFPSRRPRPAAINTDSRLAEAIPDLLRHHQRRARDPGLPHPREEDRARTGGPVPRVRGEADHHRPDAGLAAAGDHVTGMVRLRDRRTTLRRVHHQHRAAQALAHAVQAGCTSSSTTTG